MLSIRRPVAQAAEKVALCILDRIAGPAEPPYGSRTQPRPPRHPMRRR
jgi:hypothetical protein